MRNFHTFWINFKKQPDIWFFFVFLLSFPLSVRKVLLFFPLGGTFNEYNGVYLYASDLILGLTLISLLFSILYNDTISLSRYKLWINRFLHSLYLFIPAILVIISFVSIAWSQNQTIAFYRSLKLFEGYLVYLYIALRFIPVLPFHACPAGAKRFCGVEQLRKEDHRKSIVPRVPRRSEATLRGGTIEKLEKTDSASSIPANQQKLFFLYSIKNSLNKAIEYIGTTFQLKSDAGSGLEQSLNVPQKNRPHSALTPVNCSTWNNFLKLIIFLGLIESLIGIAQFILQHSIGFFFLKESLVSPSIPGVAKIILGGQKYIRAYGLFPHPNILGGFLLFSIIITLLYKKQLFHACPAGAKRLCEVEQSRKEDHRKSIVPRLPRGSEATLRGGTIAKPESTSLKHSFYQKVTAKQCTKNTLYKSQNLTITTFQSKSIIKTWLKQNTIVPHEISTGSLSYPYSDLGILQIVPRGTISSLKIFNSWNNHFHNFLRALTETYEWIVRWEKIITEKLFHVEQFRKFTIAAVNLSKSLTTSKMFHVEHFPNESVKNTAFSRGTIWLNEGLKNIHFSFKKLGFKKSWLIKAILWIQIIALFLSFSKSAMLGLLIALSYIKLFHVEQWSESAETTRATSTLHTTHVPRGTYILFSGWHKLEIYIKKHLKKIILMGLILLLLVFLVQPNLNALFFQSLEERMLYINASPVVVSIRDLANAPRLPRSSKLFHARLPARQVEQFGTLRGGTITDLSTLAFGIGSGQFVLSLPRYAIKTLENWQFQPVHNIYLEMWSELGLLGLGIFLWLIWKLFHVEHFRECLSEEQIVPRLPRRSEATLRGGTLDCHGTSVEQLENKQGSAPQNPELKESILCNDYNSLSIDITLRYFQAILLGLLFIGLFDHYLWDIWPGQVLLWIVMGVIAGIKIYLPKAEFNNLMQHLSFDKIPHKA